MENVRDRQTERIETIKCESATRWNRSSVFGLRLYTSQKSSNRNLFFSLFGLLSITLLSINFVLHCVFTAVHL